MNDQEVREQRGIQLAAFCKIERKGHVWMVPAQSKVGKYIVSPSAENPVCSCPDFEKRGQPCKHVFAVRIVEKREQNEQGDTICTQSVTVTEKISRPTYRQDWPNYNAAQMNEKRHFQELLHDLCKGIVEPPQGKGRPRLSLRDSVFAAVFKIYSTVSCRRFTCDLKDAQEKGFVDDAPHYNSIFRCLESAELTPILEAMITESSLPLKTVEVDFAVDSSGFSTSRFIRWYDAKYRSMKAEHDWIKAHIMIGVKTNVITAVRILDRDAADSPQFPPLVKDTAANFTIRETSADKAYGSFANVEAVEAVGGTPFIALRHNATGAKGGKDGVWAKMFHYFSFRRDDFLQHYHKRSNVESTFSMVKAKFRDHVRSKTDTAMKNEVLAKFVAHNICCLISAMYEMYELNIEPEFWTKDASS
jgi:transposase/predicted nucleic acid-binding Zn finger protein